MNNTAKEIATLLKSFDTITLLTHIRPDGDTLGSAYALFYALKSLNKNVKVVCESEISKRYTYLSNGESDISHECEGKIVCIDIASVELAGKKYVDIAKNADIVIDHHPTNARWAKNNLVVDNAAACGEIVYDIVTELCKITPKIAECLYTAISTDTGCFVYPSTSAHTHIIAAKLIEAGADAARLNKLLFRTKSSVCVEIERRALDSLEYFYDNTIACILIKKDWITELGATEDDLEGVSSIPTKIEGVQASVTFRQLSQNEYKLSVRSIGNVNCGAVCKIFGGGGHKNAAGCTVCGDYEEYKNKLADLLHQNKQ